MTAQDERRLQATIRHVVPNLRYRWPKELENYSDRIIALLYEDFYFSEDAGNNDEKFPEWFGMLNQYQTEAI